MKLNRTQNYDINNPDLLSLADVIDDMTDRGKAVLKLV